MQVVRMAQSAVLALVLATVGVGLVTPAQGAADAGASTSAARSSVRAVAPGFASEVLRLTNVQRTKRGLRPLTPAACTQRTSSGWARSMAARNRFRHQSMRSVARACGTSYVGENIAMGRPLGAAQVVGLWMRSKGHRANILNKNYRHLGVGAARSARTGRTYVVQNFRR